MLIKFPFVDPIYLFQRYKADINYKDSFGLTVLMHLIINKKKICKISEDHYYIIFTHLIKADNLKIELTNNNGISAFGLSLINGDFLDSFGIYGNFIKHKPQFDFEILIFIINYINQTKEYTKIANFLKSWTQGKNEFKVAVDLNHFNSLNKRSIFHYINMYSSDDDKKLYIYKTILFELIKSMKLSIDLSKKDIFNRNGLFYFFIDDNGKIKNADPYLKLELCLKNHKFNDLNDCDIYGNSLIFYAVEAKAFESIKLLLDYKASLNITNNEGNTIYSIAAILVDYDLFKLLYNYKKDKTIFLQKVYFSQQIEQNKVTKNKNIESLIDLHKKMNVSIPDKMIFKEQLSKDIEKLHLIFQKKGLN